MKGRTLRAYTQPATACGAAEVGAASGARRTMALLLERGLAHATAQSANPGIDRVPSLGVPHAQPATRRGAPDSDESIMFEDILAGVCGANSAAAARQALDSDPAAADPTAASDQAFARASNAPNRGGPIDTTVGPRTAQSSWRDPLIDSVFFSDSEGDCDQGGGQRSKRQAAGAGQERQVPSSASHWRVNCACILDQI